MVTYIKSLVVVLIGILLVMMLARRPLMPLFGGAEKWSQRFGALIAITSASFLARDFWVFCIFSAFVLWRQQARETNTPALYLFLILAVPPMSRGIPGFGLFNYLFDVSYPKLLSLVLMLPLALKMSRAPAATKFGKGRADIWIVAYFLLHQFLYFKYSSVTASMRAATDFLINVWLPYYVMSRYFKKSEQLREALVGLLLAALIASVLAIPESVKHWSFYVTVRDALNVPEWFALTLTRGGGYRAQGATGQPIILGFFVSLGFGAWLYLQRECRSPTHRWGITAILLGGLLSTLSRGPWMGALLTTVIFILIAPGRGRRAALWGGGLTVIAMGILASPFGDGLAKYLPFVDGGVEEGTVIYRQQLLQTSFSILSQYPWFGTPYFMSYMEHLRQGQGIIDLVNTYMVIALPTGYFGLFVWLMPFFIALWTEFFRARRNLACGDGTSAYMSASLVAMLAGGLLTIATVSPIGILDLMLWSLVGVMSAASTSGTGAGGATVEPA